MFVYYQKTSNPVLIATIVVSKVIIITFSVMYDDEFQEKFISSPYIDTLKIMASQIKTLITKYKLVGRQLLNGEGNIITDEFLQGCNESMLQLMVWTSQRHPKTDNGFEPNESRNKE